jgi:tetratricopeptide (TPR) repeat protein
MRYSASSLRKPPVIDVKEKILREKFAHAFAAKQAGQLEQAKALCLEVLAVNVRHAGSLHLLGIIEYESHHYEVSAKMIARALAVEGSNAFYHGNLGLVLHAMGRLDEASEEYRRALKLKPDYADAHQNLGNLYCAQGRHEESLRHYKRAVNLHPQDSAARTSLGNAYLVLGKFEKAMEQYQKALEFKPDSADAYHNIGTAYLNQEKWKQAQENYERALAIEPHYALAYYNLGICFQKQKKWERAREYYEKALELQPDSTATLMNLGVVFREQKKYKEAAAYYRKVLEVRDDSAEAHCGLADILLNSDVIDEALVHYQRAVALRPDYSEAYSNQGCALGRKNDLDGAQHSFERAVELDPGHVNAHCNLAMLLLSRGNYAEGWKHNEWRYWHKDGSTWKFSEPLWTGEPLEGKRILLHGEQGLGDDLQFLRYLPLVARAGGKVLLAVPVTLRRLVEQMPEISELYVTGDKLPGCDLQSPLMSLPIGFHTTPETIPAEVPYLTVPEEARRAAEALCWPEKGLRVGLVWAGNPHHANDRNRSMKVSDLEPLWKVDGVHLFSLQMGTGAQQVDGTAGPLIDLTPGVADMADTAARIEQLDLVIAVDTSVAHLAGALGKPVWLLVAFTPDWRWFYERTDSPWYPSMRLFRQSTPGDWKTVMENVCAALAEKAAEKSQA